MEKNSEIIEDKIDIRMKSNDVFYIAADIKELKECIKAAIENNNKFFWFYSNNGEHKKGLMLRISRIESMTITNPNVEQQNDGKK